MEDEYEKWIQTVFPWSTQKRYSIVKELCTIEKNHREAV